MAARYFHFLQATHLASGEVPADLPTKSFVVSEVGGFDTGCSDVGDLHSRWYCWGERAGGSWWELELGWGMIHRSLTTDGKHSGHFLHSRYPYRSGVHIGSNRGWFGIGAVMGSVGAGCGIGAGRRSVAHGLIEALGARRRDLV